MKKEVILRIIRIGFFILGIFLLISGIFTLLSLFTFAVPVGFFRCEGEAAAFIACWFMGIVQVVLGSFIITFLVSFWITKKYLLSLLLSLVVSLFAFILAKGLDLFLGN